MNAQHRSQKLSSQELSSQQLSSQQYKQHKQLDQDQQLDRDQQSTKRWFIIYRVLVAISTALIVTAIVLTSAYLGIAYKNDHEDKAKATYNEQVAAAYSQAKRDRLLRSARAYNSRLAQHPQRIGALINPLTGDLGSFSGDDDPEYHKLLNAPGDVMGVVSIPDIDVKLPIHHGAGASTLLDGIGHLPGSSLPIGGINTRTVLTGHSGMAMRSLFTELPQLHKGDYFFITVAGETIAYKVTTIEVVLPEDTQALRIVRGKDLATLVTCTPFGINTHRLLVTGERTQWPLNKPAPAPRPSLQTIVTWAFVAMLITALVIWIVYRWIYKPWRSTHTRQR